MHKPALKSAQTDEGYLTKIQFPVTNSKFSTSVNIPASALIEIQI